MLDVARDVVEIDAETDHRRLVGDGRDPADGAGNRGRVAKIGADDLDTVRKDDGGVRGLMVDDPHRPAGREHGSDDVGSDEAEAARDQHGASGAGHGLGAVHPLSVGARPPGTRTGR